MYRIISSENNNLRVEIDHFDPAHTFLCGQCFRWEQESGGIWAGIAYGRRLALKWDGKICTFFDMTEQEFLQRWVSYFDLETDYGLAIKELSAKDEHLRRAVSFGHGIRLLRQELWEVLLSFVISQNNGIPRIKKIIESLSVNFGKPAEGDCLRKSFPETAALAEAPLEKLNICRGGYRCRYISLIANKFHREPELFDEIRNLPPDKARELLLSLTGIGEKVADCIMLYSGLNRSVFPIDRWVKRVMEVLYFKKETDVKSIRDFSREYFGELAGIAQQYLFYYARAHKIGM